MNPREFFNPEVMHYFTSGRDYGDWTKSYWDLEFVTATVNKNHYSIYEDEWTDGPEVRTCKLCGHVHDTNEFGVLEFCQNEVCKDIRAYFGFTSGQHPFLANGKQGSTRHQRAAWLRKTIRENYGDGNLYSIYGLPIDCRLPALLSMQIVREQIEHSRTKRDADTTANFIETKPIKSKQRQGEVVDGNSGSIY